MSVFTLLQGNLMAFISGENYVRNPKAVDLVACTPERQKTLKGAMEEYEALVIFCALEANNWSRVATAKELGIGREWLWSRMRKYRLVIPRDEVEAPCPSSQN